MKIVTKIVLGNLLTIFLLALIYVFAWQVLDSVLAKLHFVELADDLNATFLEARLSEKNLFLYDDRDALQQIKLKLSDNINSINNLKTDIVRAVGRQKFDILKRNLEDYMTVIDRLERSDWKNPVTQKTIREAGRQLRDFSASITDLERKKVNRIISESKEGLFYLFFVIMLIATTTTFLFFSKMLRSLKQIERTANSISSGNFNKIEGHIPKNELGSVMEAINSMSEELQQRSEQLIQSRKLASIGTLTAGVAHELGNPLNNISMIAQAYIELVDHLDKEESIGYMNTIGQETERIRKIVQNLLDFSKPKPADMKEVDPNEVVSKSAQLVANMLHVSKIECEFDLQPGLPPVPMDEDKIIEVLVNLITNATQAMSPGGVVSLRTRLGENGQKVVLEVQDTGEGIPPQYLPHIFDPFFSTKGVDGTGLGLSVSYGIIKYHKGNMKVRSEVGIGTTFEIELPIPPSKEQDNERSKNHDYR